MASKFANLSRAQLSFEYLHTNSTTHEFLFGALAELVDNARDAQAKSIDIFSERDANVRGKRILCFLDDGEGMSPGETGNIIKFGLSSKRATDRNLIGQYGNGLKSGSMRIAKDMILFTKQESAMTCLFLSRTFHEKERLKEVIVPIPSWRESSKLPITESPAEKERHKMEMDIILQHSPFKTEYDVMRQFDKIQSPNGTLVMLYNLKVLDSGKTELDFVTDPKDIFLTVDSDMDLPSEILERNSFRAYISLLYCEPRMKIHLQGKKVKTVRLAQQLYRPRMYQYTSRRFRVRSELDAEQAVKDAKIADEKARDLEADARVLAADMVTSISKERRTAARLAEKAATDARGEANRLERIVQSKQKALADPKTLTFIFGVNINDRTREGMFIYNCSRLIKMFEKIGPQANGKQEFRGIVGIVDVPYVVLEPTHNKQDFADAKEYRYLLKVMAEHLEQYCYDQKFYTRDLDKFWSEFGYESSQSWPDPPSNELRFLRSRGMQIQQEVQCDSCLKWRIMPFSKKNLGKSFPDNWKCDQNSDASCSSCSKIEMKPKIPIGTLMKASIRQQTEPPEKRQKKADRAERWTEPSPEREREREHSGRDERHKRGKQKRLLKKGNPSAKKRRRHDSEEYFIFDEPLPFLNDNAADLTWITRNSRKKKRAKIDRWRDTSESGTEGSRGCPRDDDDESADDRDGGLPDLTSDNDDDPVVAGVYSKGALVEARLNGKWCTGRVAHIQPCRAELGPDQVGVYFDHLTNQKKPCWYDFNGTDLRLCGASRELPSDGNAVSEIDRDFHPKIAANLREFVAFCYPPGFQDMTKEQCKELSLAELANFPLDQYLTCHQQNISKMLLEVEKQVDKEKKKLSALRKNVKEVLSKLLHVDLPSLGLEEDGDLDKVDDAVKSLLEF